jgi:hydrogenase maturation protease
VEVARALVARQPWPDYVRIADFGVRGADVAKELLERRYDLAVFVDATSRGGRPGTMYVNDIDLSRPPGPPPATDAADMAPEAVLALLGKLGGVPPRVVVVGCEPARVERGVGLSDPVLTAVAAAVTTVTDIIRETTQASGRYATYR